MQKPTLQAILISILIIVALFTSIYFPYKWKQLSNGFLYQTNQYGELLKQINDLQKEVRELKNGEGENAELEDWKTYRNEEFGFEITLIDSWKGFSAITESWQGTTLDDNSIQFQGPKILLRNPNWTTVKPYWQDIPVLIFTKQEWQLIEAENLSIFAAPIGPIKLGENQQYVFALPPRWVGFSDTLGQDEAEQIAETFKAFQIKNETADWKIYRNDEYSYEIKYPKDWQFIKLNEKGFDLLAPERTYFELEGKTYSHLYEIRVQVASTPSICLNYPFEKLIRDANCIGIEGYENLYSVKEIITNTGVKGYETVWNAGTHIWFELQNLPQPNKQNVRSIQTSRVDDKKVIKIYNQMLSTFKFLSTDKTANWKTYKKDIFTLKYHSEIWNLKDERLFHKEIGDSCMIIPGGLWRQSIIKIVESMNTNFNDYEARQVMLGSNKNEVSIINVYFDANLPGKEFRLSLPKDKQDKQICENDFKEVLSTIKFEK